jgi:cyclophilin family peptidyl-prolyl cis-trans isomerase
MSKTHMSKRDERRNARARQKLYNRIFLIGIIIMIFVVAAWLIWSSQQAKPVRTQTPTSGGPTPQLVGTKQYSAAPPMLIDVTKQYFATEVMAKGGEFVIQLFPDKAPITVNSFVFLARQGFFNGVTFHRVIKGFMAQGGDPTGTGSGGPGYQFVNELNDLKFDKAGVVAMANAGPNTNGSQFFITFGPYAGSESDYTIFGQVISGMDVVNGITPRDPAQDPTFTGDVIESITISEK